VIIDVSEIGTLALRLADVALSSRSGRGMSPVMLSAAQVVISNKSANSVASVVAFTSVRLTIVKDEGFCSIRGCKIPRTAPPAPRIIMLALSRFKPRLPVRSFNKPVPSVLCPQSLPDAFLYSVLTACAREAFSVSSSQSLNADSLKGAVTLQSVYRR